MADTLGAMTVRILRMTGQNPNKTGLADTDDTQWVADRINEAMQYLFNLKPFEIDLNGSITLPASTRLMDGPAGLDLYRIYDWSWRVNQTTGDVKINPVTQEFIVNSFPLYESNEGDYPEYVYLEGGQVGFYPLLKSSSASQIIQFIYPSMQSRLTDWASTFPFEDNTEELLYCETYTKLEYEIYKGLGDPDETRDKLLTLKGILKVKYARAKRQGLKRYRRFS